MKDSQSFRSIQYSVFSIHRLGPGHAADSTVTLTAADSFTTVPGEDLFPGDAVESL